MIRRFEARGACSTITLTTSSRIETSRPSIALSLRFSSSRSSADEFPASSCRVMESCLRMSSVSRSGGRLPVLKRCLSIGS